MSLREIILSSVRWTTASTIGRAILQVTQVVVLARLLAPEDFGLIAIVLAVMAIVQIFADAGVSNAIFHYRNVTNKQLSSLYWLNIITSTTLAVLLTGFSFWVVTWYEQPLLQPLFSVAAATMVVGAMWYQLFIKSQKELRFGVLAKIELISALVSFVVTICLAWAGFGVLSIGLGTLVGSTVACGLGWSWLADGWRPLIRLKLWEIRPFIKFGGYMVGSNLTNTFNSQIDVLLGSSILGPQLIGLYSVPKELCLRIAGIFNPVITQISLPVMANSANSQQVKKIYLKSLRMTASVNFPSYTILAFYAQEIGLLLLGSEWQASITIIQILACWGLIRASASPIGSLLIASGRADLAFKWNCAILLIVPPVLYFACAHGVRGIAVSMLLLAVVTYVPSWYFLVRPLCGARFSEYSIQLIIPVTISFFSTAGVYFFVDQWSGHDISRLIVGIGATGFAYYSLSLIFNREWTDAIRDILKFKL
jgi:lipopolysaccharide exporter